jgi:hypothetical protein
LILFALPKLDELLKDHYPALARLSAPRCCLPPSGCSGTP